VYIEGDVSSENHITYREYLSKNITDELNDKEYVSRSKDGQKGVFSRDRKLTFKYLVMFIISAKGALQRELDRFFKSVSDKEFNIRKVTKSAFSQSRSKLNPWAFVRLNEIVVNTFYERNLINTWKGFRILAVDGSRLILPRHKTIIEEFGEHMMGPKADSPRSIALISMLYDVLNHVTIDAQMAPYSDSEKDLLEKHICKIEDDDLLLTDRGYPSIKLMYQLKSKRINFCIRMKDDWWLKVKEFTESTDKERLVEFTLPKKDHKHFVHCPQILEKPIVCRLVKIDLPTGEKEILCTSLIDFEQYPYDQFDALYHTRWNEEEAYKLLKSRIEVEDFSGKTAIAVKQDFFSKILLMSLCAAYAYPIEEKVRKEYAASQHRKYAQQINHTNALAMTKDILVSVFIKFKFKEAIAAFDDNVHNTREIVRPGRSVERKHKPKKTYSMNYKQL
jgi:hypothetical protein